MSSVLGVSKRRSVVAQILAVVMLSATLGTGIALAVELPKDTGVKIGTGCNTNSSPHPDCTSCVDAKCYTPYPKKDGKDTASYQTCRTSGHQQCDD
jgi:hypothetical protein